MLSGMAGADIAVAVTAGTIIAGTAFAASGSRLFVWQRPARGAEPERTYPRFAPVADRAGRFTREPVAETAGEREHALQSGS